MRSRLKTPDHITLEIALREIQEEEDRPRLFRLWHAANLWKWPSGLGGKPPGFDGYPRNGEGVTKKLCFGKIMFAIELKLGMDYIDGKLKEIE